ncbi:MAG TPA: amino acid permease, partial [Pseudonocardia sp.]|nr:amino acid permease [Pseudonocardia sp.]
MSPTPGARQPGPQADRPAPALRRALRERHLTMIALGGTVGAGLFVGSGAVIAAAGPAVVLAYALGGLVVVLVMRMLAEMAVAQPSTGSFVDHARQGVGDWAGYAVGWLYWWGWVVALAFEAVAGASILHGWLPQVPLGAWALGMLVLVVAGNLLSVRSFGESEFWLALLKILAIVAFGVLGGLAVLGLLPGRDPGLPGLAGADLVPLGWLPVLTALVAVLFTYGGTEIVAIAAGEAADPRRALVRATRQVVGRIVLFYVGSIALVV